MKTIQAVKQTKNVQLGQLKRVDEREADSEVRGGYWKYVPKSEWKLQTRTPKTEDTQPKEKKSTKNAKNNK